MLSLLKMLSWVEIFYFGYCVKREFEEMVGKYVVVGYVEICFVELLVGL